uniref:Uncharacterized protein n=1 Tax=Arundo donax TaxID=35708 RepID=A0A0A8Y0K7_ARUDO
MRVPQLQMRPTNTNEGATKAKLSMPRSLREKMKGDDEEAVGVDEEGQYSDTESLVALSDSSYDTNLAASSNSDCSNFDSDPEYEPNGEILDEDEDLPVFAYDIDDPCIDVDVVFPDVDQCKSAVTHHAILNDVLF